MSSRHRRTSSSATATAEVTRCSWTLLMLLLVDRAERRVRLAVPLELRLRRLRPRRGNGSRTGHQRYLGKHHGSLLEVVLGMKGMLRMPRRDRRHIKAAELLLDIAGADGAGLRNRSVLHLGLADLLVRATSQPGIALPPLTEQHVDLGGGFRQQLLIIHGPGSGHIPGHDTEHGLSEELLGLASRHSQAASLASRRARVAATLLAIHSGVCLTPVGPLLALLALRSFASASGVCDAANRRA